MKKRAHFCFEKRAFAHFFLGFLKILVNFMKKCGQKPTFCPLFLTKVGSDF